MGLQQPIMVAQTVLTKADVSVGVSIMIFFQTLSGTVFLSIAETVFENKLLLELHNVVPGLNPAIVTGNGAANLAQTIGKIDPQYVQGVLMAYNRGIQEVFIVGTIMACLAIIGTLGMEWRSVKGKGKGKSKEKTISWALCLS